MTNLAIVFLQETKCLADQIHELRGKVWARWESMGIDARGFSRGLSILWDPYWVHLSGFKGTHNSLTTNFRVVGFPIYGIVTNVYGPQKVGDKRGFLGYLISLREIFPNDHWGVGGDFNLINSLEEKKGGRHCLEEECDLFR